MPANQDEAVEKIRRDHEQLLELIRRIKAECTQSHKIDHCNDCQPNLRQVCHGNIEQLIRRFVEMTLKHNLVESMFMAQLVPSAHRIAHNQAHIDMAEQLKTIRVVFSEDGNCVLAIEGIDAAQRALLAHFREYDQQLESYLLAAG